MELKAVSRVKRALAESTTRLSGAGMNDQGFGLFQFSNFVRAFTRLAQEADTGYVLLPGKINLGTRDGYFFPYSAQPLYCALKRDRYTTAVPLSVTVQIANQLQASYTIQGVEGRNRSAQAQFHASRRRRCVRGKGLWRRCFSVSVGRCFGEAVDG